MCSRFNDTIQFTLVAAVLASGASCARPQGTLFEPLDHARVWPPPPDAPRIRFVGSISDSGDLKAARSAGEGFLAVVRGSRPPIRFSGPHSVALWGTNLVAVADAAGRGVHIIDLAARTHVLVSGWAKERFEVPIGVVWADGRLFATDAKRAEVVELDSSGGFRASFGADVLHRPVGIAYAAGRDELYVVDGGAHALAVFRPDGTFVRSVGGPGNEPGRFNYPTHIACRGDRLLVADSGNFRVQLLDLDGHWLRTIGKKGDGAGDLALPKGVAFDRDGRIYIVDAHFENVQVFRDDGRLLMAFGAEGRGPGEFWLPAGLSIDDAGRIWVADAGNRRLQVFEGVRTAS